MQPVFSSDLMMTSVTRDADFAEWFVEEVMKLHVPDPYFTVSPEGLREMTINGRTCARQCGISDSPSQAHFVILMWKIGPNFWQHPGFREVAMNPTIAGPEKIDRFYAVPKEQAVHAIMNPDDRAWFSNVSEPIR